MIVGITFLLKIMNLTTKQKSPPSFGRGGGLNLIYSKTLGNERFYCTHFNKKEVQTQ